MILIAITLMIIIQEILHLLKIQTIILYVSVQL